MDRILNLVENLKDRVDRLDNTATPNRKRRGSTPNRGEPPKTTRRSENPDFRLLTKEVFKHALLEKAIPNWDTTPDFLKTSLNKVVDSIRIPNGTDRLNQRLHSLADSFAKNITTEIRQFLRNEEADSVKRLRRLDNTDLDLAKFIASKYMDKRSHKPGTSNYRLDTDNNRATTPKPGTSHVLDNASDSEVLDISDHLDSMQIMEPKKGKRKGHFTPEPIKPSTSTDYSLNTQHIVSASDDDMDNPNQHQSKPDAKKLRPSSANLQPSDRVTVFTGLKSNWSIKPTEAAEVVVLADSNMRLAKAPESFEFFILPGAHLRHCSDALRDLRMDGTKKFCIQIQVGINNRGQHPDAMDNEIQELQRILAKNPHISRTIFVGVSIPKGLTPIEERNLMHLNHRMLDIFGPPDFVEPLAPDDIHINPEDRFGIHYTHNTCQSIVSKMAEKLQSTTPLF